MVYLSDLTTYFYVAYQLYRYRADSPSLEVSFAAGMHGNFILEGHDYEDEEILMSSSFLSCIKCREAALKAKRILFVRRPSFADMVYPRYNAPIRPPLEHTMQRFSLNYVAGTDSLELFISIKRCELPFSHLFKRIPPSHRISICY